MPKISRRPAMQLPSTNSPMRCGCKTDYQRTHSTPIVPTCHYLLCGLLVASAYCLDVSSSDIGDYLAELSSTKRATTQRRVLAALRRFYRMQLAENRIKLDPTVQTDSPVAPHRFPKTLSEAQVEALLAAPDINTPQGLRDRAMFETIYATGLRVSELVQLKIFEMDLQSGLVRVIGKGSKERLVPLGEWAIEWINRYLSSARTILSNKPCEAVFLNRFWRANDASDVLADREASRHSSGHHRQQHFTAYAAPRICHALAQSRCGLAGCATIVRALRYIDDTNIHTRGKRAIEETPR